MLWQILHYFLDLLIQVQMFALFGRQIALHQNHQQRRYMYLLRRHHRCPHYLAHPVGQLLELWPRYHLLHQHHRAPRPLRYLQLHHCLQLRP